MPRTGYGVKSDEATYVAMALSVAYDGDLTYEKRDLERFAGLYHSGPNGIFLKRGKHLRDRIRRAVPVRPPDQSATTRIPDRLYYGKAFIYPVLAAPFVRLYGLNGLLIVNVLLLAMAVVCAYVFLAAQSPPVERGAFHLGLLRRGGAAGVRRLPDAGHLQPGGRPAGVLLLVVQGGPRSGSSG